MEHESMLFVTNRLPYLWDILNSFSDGFFDFYSCGVVSSREIRRNEAKSFRVHNGGWRETLNLLHVSSCEMLHFVMSYMTQDNLAPRVFVPLDQRSENESSGSNHFEITEFCPSRFAAQSASMAHAWNGCSIVAPRALVFRPLVKGNEDSGNEIGPKTEKLRSNFKQLMCRVTEYVKYNLR